MQVRRVLMIEEEESQKNVEDVITSTSTVYVVHARELRPVSTRACVRGMVSFAFHVKEAFLYRNYYRYVSEEPCQSA